MEIIPTLSDGSPFYEQITALGGKDFILDFRFNQREEAWYLSLYEIDESRTPILEGVKIVTGILLLERYASHALPPGDLMAIASGEDDSPPGLTELGEGLRVELRYLTEEDLASA